MFDFLRTCHAVSHSSTVLHSFQQGTEILISSHPEYLFSFFFLIVAIVMGIKRYRIMVLIYIYLTIVDIEHLFMYLSTSCITS